MNKPLVIILSAVTLDAIGIGLIFPILPRLLETVTHSDNVAPYVGVNWERKFGDTADLARDEGEDVDALAAVFGVRLLF